MHWDARITRPENYSGTAFNSIRQDGIVSNGECWPTPRAECTAIGTGSVIEEARSKRKLVNHTGDLKVMNRTGFD